MSDLRKAAEMALELLENHVEDARCEVSICKTVAALRQALAQPDEVLVEREACAKVADQWDTAITDKVAEAIRARGENPPVKTYCGGKPNYCTPGVTPDVDAVNMSQERVDETAKREHDSLGSEWAECVKLPIVVHVRKQRDGETHISTREGITPVLSDDLIMRGVAGEEYPIGRELFERTYTFDTAPPKREWVGLTDEEIKTIVNSNTHDDCGYDIWCSGAGVAKSVEAKLKERNT